MIYEFYSLDARIKYLLVREESNTWINFNSTFTHCKGADDWSERKIEYEMNALGSLELSLENPLKENQETVLKAIIKALKENHPEVIL